MQLLAFPEHERARDMDRLVERADLVDIGHVGEVHIQVKVIEALVDGVVPAMARRTLDSVSELDDEQFLERLDELLPEDSRR